MTSEIPKVSPTGRYSTTETYKALGISYNTLMKYMFLGYIRPSVGKSRRSFLGSEIIRCWRIV